QASTDSYQASPKSPGSATGSARKRSNCNFDTGKRWTARASSGSSRTGNPVRSGDHCIELVLHEVEQRETARSRPAIRRQVKPADRCPALRIAQGNGVGCEL